MGAVVRNIAAPIVGSRVFYESALDKIVGDLAKRGFCSSYMRVSPDWALTRGGRLVVPDRLNPARAWVAPTTAASPAYVSSVANGKDGLAFVSASSQYMVMSDPGMAVGTTAGWVCVIFKDTATVNSKQIFGNSTLTAAGDKPLNLNLGLSGATEFLRLVAGDNATVRVQESVLTDLNTNVFHTFLLSWDGTAGFKFILDQVAKTLASGGSDMNGLSSGLFDIGKRGSTYGDFVLCAQMHGSVNLGLSTYDTLRASLLSAASADFGTA